ncbi:MAG TPA: hypothetical protein VF677_08610 [Flavobacterium sp.]|jgi:hypothetical protein
MEKNKINYIYVMPIMVIIFLVLFSCKKSSLKKYYPSGNLKYTEKHVGENKVETIFYYDEVGELVYKKIYHLTDFDSLNFYYKNGVLYKNGKQDKRGLKYGNWDRYTLEGLISETREYYIIKDDYVLNRQWYYSKSGDTLWYANKFNRYNQKEFANDTLASRNSTMIRFDFYSKDTLNINEPFAASVICNSPLGRKYNSQIMMLLGNEEKNFDKYFSNDKEVQLDTFHNILIDKKNRVNFPDLKTENYRYIAVFGKFFKKPGKKILRGYMLEYFTIPKNKLRSERKVYFEKEVYVVP